MKGFPNSYLQEMNHGIFSKPSTPVIPGGQEVFGTLINLLRRCFFCVVPRPKYSQGMTGRLGISMVCGSFSTNSKN